MASQRQRPSNVGTGNNPFLPSNPFVPPNPVPSPPAYWKGYSRKEDEELAEELFFGRTVRGKTGRTNKEYLVTDSPRERAAVEALVRLLSRDDCMEIKALLFDALKSDGKAERRLVFQFRRKGKRSNLSANFAVALWVATRVTKDRWQVKAAVSEAMSEFGLSRKAVFAAIQRAKKSMRS